MNQYPVALVQPVLNSGRDILRFGRSANHVRNLQKCGTWQANVDKRSLHSGQHTLHLAQIDIADHATGGIALNIDFLQHAVFQVGCPGFALRDVDQNLDTRLLEIGRGKT